MESALMLGVNSKAIRQKENYYATDPQAVSIFLDKMVEDEVILNNSLWEVSCGGGHISSVLENRGYSVKSSDIVDRGFKGTEIINFLTIKPKDINWNGDIITNPPFKFAENFVRQAFNILKDGNKLFLFLKIQFLESKARKSLFNKYPLKYIYVYSERQRTAKNGDFDKYINGNTLCFAWFIWEKGFKGDTILRWI